jgi:hypothetical protein
MAAQWNTILQTAQEFSMIRITSHYRTQQLQKLYRSETDARLARRIHGVSLASKGSTCPQIMEIIGAARRTIQQWIANYIFGGTQRS